MTASSRSSRRWIGLVAGCVVLAACGVVSAAGAAGFWFLRSRAPASTPTVEYILDASPRMTEASEGSTRLSIAQGVLAEIVRPADTGVTAGLRVFGTGRQDAICQDSDLLVPLAPASQGLISDTLAELTAGAGADAALAEAMVAAIRDLAATGGPHSLVVVTGGADSCNPEAGQLIAREAVNAGIELELFVVGFQVSVEEAAAIKGVVDQTAGATFLSADDADELRRALAAIQARVDRPGTTTVADVVATASVIVPPTAPSVATTVAGPTGVLSLTVLSYLGQPAEGGGRLIVQAYSPQDHQTPLAIDYGNPTALRLPAGSYDIKMSYTASEFGSFWGGETAQWLEATIVAGETTFRSFDLQLGEVNLVVMEAAGKPIVAENYDFGFRIYRQDDRADVVAWAIVTSTATLRLPAGRYDVVVDFQNTNLIGWDQPGQTFEIIPGRSGAYTVDLKLGHLLVEVVDRAGQPVPPSEVVAYAFASDQPDLAFAHSFGANPGDLTLQAGVSYSIKLTLGTGQNLTLTDQQVQAGELRRMTVSASDFK